MPDFDWAAFEDAIVDGVVTAVREHQGERVVVAALDRIYRETDGIIALPNLGLDSAEAAARRAANKDDDDDEWWNPADWDHYDDAWLPQDVGLRWERELTAYACRGRRDDWESTWDSYVSTLVRACRRARAELRDVLVVLLDEQHYEAWIRLVLTEAELAEHFPALVAAAVELARVHALPLGEQASYFAARLRHEGREEAESELRGLGSAAIPALLPLLARKDLAWQAAKLLADIGQATDDVTAALEVALLKRKGPDQAWVARALARLGRLEIVLQHQNRLSDDVVATAVAAPYAGFRDDATHPLRLDYRPLEDILDQRPSYGPLLDTELRPGSGYCTISVDEVGEAVRGLGSAHVIVRRHAVCVVGDRALGSEVAGTVLPLLADVLRTDPDPTVRRLAILSTLWWHNDSRSYADIIREARDDPDAAVRDTAVMWLRDQG